MSSEKIDQSHPHQSTTTTTATTIATKNPTHAGPTVPMGYPPAIGYPPPYQPYPPPNAHHPYNSYAQPPPPQPPYYPNHHYTYPPPAGTAGGGGGGGGGSSFVRGFLAMIIAVVVFSCVASIITWLVLRPRIPVFRVESLAVSDFNLTRPDFAAEWVANVTAENPNHKLKVYFEQVRGYVYHKEDFLASAGVDPVFLATRARETMAARLLANNTEQHSVGRWVVDEMARERGGGGGAVSFNLRMLVLATFKSGSWWTRHASMKVFCEDLRVTFVGAETRGLFVNSGDKPKECNVYYA